MSELRELTDAELDLVGGGFASVRCEPICCEPIRCCEPKCDPCGLQLLQPVKLRAF